MTKTVFITGSSSGFGKATVAAFHAVGWNVVATMRGNSVEDFRAAWDRDVDRMLILPLDVTDSEATEASLQTAAAHFGGIDVLVNIAGFGMFHPFETTTAEDVRLVFDTNCFGPMTLMRQVIPHLRMRGGGTIVNVTAGSAVVPEPLMAVYNASKAALDNLSETIRYEVAPQDISVRVVEPGFVPTTGFVQRVLETAATREVPDVYQDYVNQRMASFEAVTDQPLASSADVAQVILQAATDDSRQLRYLVGGDQADEPTCGTPPPSPSTTHGPGHSSVRVPTVRHSIQLLTVGMSRVRRARIRLPATASPRSYSAESELRQG